MGLMLCAGLMLLCAAIIPFSASGASFTVDQISVTSPENVSSGVSIQVSARVSFDSSGEVTFLGSDTLQLSKALNEPEWQYNLIVDNHPVQTFYRENGVVFINGYYLEYAQGRSEYLSVEVSGVVPEVPEGMIDVLAVTQYDGYGNVRGDGISTVSLLVDTNTEPVTPEEPSVPESAMPVPTESSFNGLVAILAITYAFAAIPAGKKED